MTRILIIKLGALGDVINTLPLVNIIKKHLNAEIHWLVAPLSYPLVDSHASVDRTILFDKKNFKTSLPEAIKKIRQTKYDIVLDLQRLLKSGLFCMAAKAEQRIGFDKKRCKEMSWLFPFERIPPSDPNAHMLTQYLEFAKYLGIKSNESTWDIPWVKQLDNNTLNIEHDYIVLNIGATKPANRWSAENFARLAEIITEKTDFLPLLTGGKEDQAYSKVIKAKAACKIKDTCGKTSIKELAIIISNAKCVVSCDTGPMHLAVALKKNLIALFGPSNPARTGPFKGTIIQQQLHCSPCNRKKCDNPVCMERIKPEHVMVKLFQKL